MGFFGPVGKNAILGKIAANRPEIALRQSPAYQSIGYVPHSRSSSMT